MHDQKYVREVIFHEKSLQEMQAFVNQNEDEYDMENEEEEVDMNDFGTQDHEILVVVVWKSQLLRLLLHFYRSCCNESRGGSSHNFP